MRRAMIRAALWLFVLGGGFLCLYFSFYGGLVLLPFVATGAVLLMLRPSRVDGWGAMLWTAVPVVLYVSYVNWGGPGQVCRDIGGGEYCGPAISPWPWVAVAVVLAAAGYLLCRRGRRQDERRFPESYRRQ